MSLLPEDDITAQHVTTTTTVTTATTTTSSKPFGSRETHCKYSYPMKNNNIGQLMHSSYFSDISCVVVTYIHMYLILCIL